MLCVPKAKRQTCINCTLPTWEKDKHSPAESIKDVVHSKSNMTLKCLIVCFALILLILIWRKDIASQAEETGKRRSSTHPDQLHQCGFGF